MLYDPIALEFWDFLIASNVCSSENPKGLASENFLEILFIFREGMQLVCLTTDVFCTLKWIASGWLI